MDPIKSFLNKAKLARKQSYKNLTVFLAFPGFVLFVYLAYALLWVSKIIA